MYDGGISGNALHNYLLPQTNYLGESGSIPVLGIVADGKAVVIPVGYMLEQIVAVKTTAGDLTVDFGVTAGGSEIGLGDVIIGSTTTIFNYSYANDPTFLSFDIYISCVAWGGNSVDIYFIIRKVK